MSKCPNCGHKWKDDGRVRNGREVAARAVRCEVCGRIVRRGQHLCVCCAEVALLRQRVADPGAEGGAA